MFLFLRVCLRTWTLVDVSSQSWIFLCKNLVAETPFFLNSLVIPSASSQKCITRPHG